MNYYNKNNDYYNYVNNTYNQPLYNQSSNNKKILDPYNGFVRGNMFSDLYNGYKLNKPLDITPLNEQADMLTYIDSLCKIEELSEKTEADDPDRFGEVDTDIFDALLTETNELVHFKRNTVSDQ